MATIPQTGSRLPRSAPDTGRALGARRSHFDTSLLRDLDPLLIGATLAITALGMLVVAA